MVLAIALLHFASDIIGRYGSVNVDLGEGGFIFTISGNPITLKDIITAMEQVEEEFDEYCWKNGLIRPVHEIIYDEVSNTYRFSW